MECDICCRKHTSDLNFFCVGCARSSIYMTRLESAKVLLAKEQVALKVEAVVSTKPENTEKDSPSSVWNVETAKAHKQDADTRTQETLDHVRTLREELELAGKDISARKAHLASRKADLKAINARLPAQRSHRETKIADTTKRGNLSFTALDDRSVETRAFLCREAAVLLGLKQRKKRKGDSIIDQYYLGALPIVDLKECYNTRCTELNAVLASIAHLLTLVAFYLSVRLPSEIILPQRDSPLTTIFKADDSYISRKQPSSSTTPMKSGNKSPSASRHEDGSGFPRPRPLFIGSGEKDERIANVYNNDPAAFGLFNEGVSLLALNVAWLCRSQGLHAGTEVWNDITNMGKNLWHLLLAPPQSLPGRAEAATLRPKTGQKTSRNPSAVSTPCFRLGQGSHSSAHHFLGSPEALERNFQLPKLAVMAGQLKAAIHADTKNAEWELLSQDEWDDGTEQFDEAVHIRTRAMDGHDFDDARSIMTTRTRLGEGGDRTIATPSEAGEDIKAPKTAGTSGWTRVRGREK